MVMEGHRCASCQCRAIHLCLKDIQENMESIYSVTEKMAEQDGTGGHWLSRLKMLLNQIQELDVHFQLLENTIARAPSQQRAVAH